MPLRILQRARDGWTRKSWPREALIFVGLAAAYFVAAQLGFRAALVAEQVSATWPPSGLALWAALFFGRRAWPAIWVGALSANLSTNIPVLVAAGIATGNTLEAIVGARLLRDFADVDRSLDRLRQVTALIILAAIMSTMVSATIGVFTLCAAGLQNWNAFGMLWRTWWLGDLMGDVLLAPLLLTLPSWIAPRRAISWLELLALETVAIVLSLLIFTGRASPLATHPLEYAVFPVVIWAGMRFAHPGAAIVNTTISRIAIYGTLRGMGPFGSVPATQEQVIALQIYAGLTAVSGLVLGAAVADRRRSELLRQTDHALTTILSEERDLEHATPRIIKAVCETLEWEVGLLWQVNKGSETLDLVDSWYKTPRLKRFVEDSRTHQFRSGIGLPGRVWANGQPAWVYDIAVETNFPRMRIARELGLHGGFAFPLLFGSRALGVIEFYTSSPRRIDRSMLTLMEAAGSQIGQFIERRRAEQRVVESEALYSAIINTALDCIVTIDSAGTILEFNPAATLAFGFSRAEALGRDLADLVVPGRFRDQYHEVLQRTVETGQSSILGHRVEMTARRADGSEFLVEVAVTRVGGPGQPIFTAHMRDITDRKQSENEREELLARERLARLEAETANRSKDQFLATVSHELRTPLTAILGWASMLKTRSFDPQRTQQIYDSLERNAQAQAQIVGDLLDVSRIITGQLRLESETLDVCEVANLSLETIRPTTVAKGVSLVSDIAPTACLVSGDPARLQQIIWNLLSNAAKFTPAGGTISVRVGRDQSHVVIEVADTGIGVAPNLLPRVFDRFWQADGSTTRVHGGLGLGLALVRHLVELHGGDVSAHSDGEGCGSRFTVRLPARAGEGVPHAPAESTRRRLETGTDFKGVTVLIVDDDRETRELFTEVLRLQGARAVSAASAAEGFAALESESVGVILMDIGMPGEDGFSLLARIRAREAEKGLLPTPVISVTAYAGPNARAEALRAGFADYLAKPAAPDDVLRAIHYVLAVSGRHTGDGA